MSGGTVGDTDKTITLDYGTRRRSFFDERIRSPQVSRIQAILLFLIFAAAITIRFIGIERMSVFMDEVWVVELAMGNGQLHDAIPFNEVQRNVSPPTQLSSAGSALNIVRQVQGITHPPGYVFALRLWCDLFGTTDQATRGLSAVASALAVLALFDVVRRVYGTRAALWSALIMALAGPQVELAQEVRPYALLTLMSLLCADAILIIHSECANSSENKRLRSRISSFILQPSSLCISLALLIFLTMLMHYFAAGVMLGLGAYTIIVLRGRARWMVLGSFALAATIFCITWLPKMISQRETVAKTADTWLKEPPGGHLIRTASRLADVPLRLLILHEIANDRYSRNLKYGSIGIVIVPFFLLRRGRGRGDLALLCWWLGGTLGLLVALDISRDTRHLELVRYCLIAGPAIYALPAALALRAHAWIRNGIPALVAFSCLCALPALVDLSKQKYREAGVYLDKHVEPGDVVVIFNYDNEPFYAAFTWLSLAHYSEKYPWPFILVNGPFDNHIREQLKDAHAIWIVAPPGRVSPEKIVPGADPKYLDYFHRFAEIYRLPAPGKEKD